MLFIAEQFTINYVNGWGIVVITIVAAGIAALIIAIAVTRLRKRVR